jgi:hypothetical protein
MILWILPVELALSVETPQRRSVGCPLLAIARPTGAFRGADDGQKPFGASESGILKHSDAKLSFKEMKFNLTGAERMQPVWTVVARD